MHERLVELAQAYVDVREYHQNALLTEKWDAIVKYICAMKPTPKPLEPGERVQVSNLEVIYDIVAVTGPLAWLRAGEYNRFEPVANLRRVDPD